MEGALRRSTSPARRGCRAGAFVLIIIDVLTKLLPEFDKGIEQGEGRDLAVHQLQEVGQLQGMPDRTYPPPERAHAVQADEPGENL